MGKRLPEAAENDIVTLDQGKSEVGALALITYDPEKYTAAVYQPFADRLTGAINSVRTIDYDIKTTAGMAAAVTARATFRDLRVEAENERKTRKAPIISIGKLLESGYNNLEARITPLEELFDGDIQEETKRKAEVKAEKDRIEGERAAAIRAKIAEISSLPAKHARATAAQLTDALRELAAREIMKEEFAEQTDDARAAVEAAAAELIALRDVATASEAAAIVAEEARKAEVQRAADEAAAVAKQKVENERVANENAIAAKRLADQEAAQALVAKQLADKVAANLKADQDALAEQVRLQREAQEKNRMALSQIEAIRHQAVIAEVGRSPYVKGGDAASYLFVLAETRAWVIEDEQFGVLTASAQMVKDSTIVMLEQGLASCIAADHVEALTDNAQFDVDREAERVRKQAMADQHLADKRNLPPPESCCARDARINEGFDETPTDGEILDVYVENFGGTREQAIERLALFDAVAARAELVPA